MSVPLMIASPLIAGTLAYEAGKENSIETVEQLREDTTSAFKEVEKAIENQMKTTEIMFSELNSKITNNSQAQTISNFVANNLISSDESGNLKSSGYEVDDLKQASNKVIWTSNKIPLIDGISGNFAIFNGNGTVADYGVFMDDTAQPDPFVIYSSAKNDIELRKAITDLKKDNSLSSNKMNLVTGAPIDSLASFDATGQVKSSGILQSDLLDIPIQLEAVSQTANDALATAKSASDSVKLVGKVGNVPIYNSLNSLQDSLISSDSLMIKKIPKFQNSIAVLDSFGQVIDSGYGIDNDVESAKTLWTSDVLNLEFVKTKPGSGLAKFTQQGQFEDTGIIPSEIVKNVVPKLPNSIAFLDDLGYLKDSEKLIDDTAVPSPNVIWSSEKIMSQFKGNGGLAQMNVDGTLTDTGIDVTKLATKITNPAGNFITTDSTGNFTDSGFKVDDTQPPTSNIVWSSLKTDENYIKKLIGNYTVPHLTPDGQLEDSNISLLDLQMTTIPQSENNLASLSVDGKLMDSGYLVDDSKIDLSTLWTSQKIDSSYLEKPTTFVVDNIAVFDVNGIKDSGFVIDDLHLFLEFLVRNSYL